MFGGYIPTLHFSDFSVDNDTKLLQYSTCTLFHHSHLGIIPSGKPT
jgi:hypothetical protein